MNNDFNLHKGQGFFGLKPETGKLRGQFVMVPYSTLNAREGAWLRRKRLWLRRGIKSEEGRPGRLTFKVPNVMSDGREGSRIKDGPSTSTFDPVLCELAYGWWCKPGGIVLDPFAGGSVRGIVASILDRKYYGIELRKIQVEANKKQINESTSGKYKPKWVCGDANDLVADAPKADFLFTCPPYGNLEVYSDDPKDISNMSYDDFIKTYTEIIHKSLERLKENRFACVVVGNYRNKEDGTMINFVGDTIKAFESGGAKFYNDVILINPVGSSVLRVGNTFIRGHRKIVKVHQNVLVFIKGKPKKAAQQIPLCDGQDAQGAHNSQ